MPQYLLFFLYLAGTIILEGFLLWVLVRLCFRIQRSDIGNPLLLFACCSSVATLPYVWFVFPPMFGSQTGFLLVAESFAVGVEMLIYVFTLWLGTKRALLASLMCNTASFALGQVVNSLLF